MSAILQLIRPLNTALTFLSACLGGLCADLLPWEGQVLWAALAAACIAAAGYISNDLADIAIDRVNRPDRPLPAGRISPSAARRLAVGLGVAGLLLALLPGWPTAALALTVVGLLLLYNHRLKRTALWGNLLVALLGALVFPFGALASGGLGKSWIPAGFAFLFHLGREILKDLEDVEGDRLAGARTLPLRWTTKGSARIAAALFAVLLPFTLVPWFSGLYGLAYLLPVALVDANILWVSWRLLRQPDQRVGQNLSARLKPAMLLGLTAILLGELTRWH